MYTYNPLLTKIDDIFDRILQAVSDHSPLVRMRYEQAHSDWVLQVGWTGPAGYIISASQSTRPSMLIQHVSAQRKKYCFEQRMVRELL